MKTDMNVQAVSRRLKQVEKLKRLCFSLADKRFDIFPGSKINRQINYR